VADGFSAHFAFRISDPINGGADGLVFVLQSSPAGASALANNGGGLGYAGMAPSLGIEFDTWDNGPAADAYSSNHVGININGSVASVTSAPVSSIEDGVVRHVWVDYDGSQLEVRLSTAPVKPADAILTYSVDLGAILGTGDAYVGFTSGTGWAGADHDILCAPFEFEAGTPMSLQAGKVVIDTNDEDMDFAVFRTRDMTGLGAAVAADVPLTVKFGTDDGSPWAFSYTTTITADDINGNKLQYEDDVIKMYCHLGNELCSTIYVKRTDIDEDYLPQDPDFVVLPDADWTVQNLKLSVEIDGKEFVYNAPWWKTVTPNLIRYNDAP
jgi:hypothetical protein